MTQQLGHDNAVPIIRGSGNGAGASLGLELVVIPHVGVEQVQEQLRASQRARQRQVPDGRQGWRKGKNEPIRKRTGSMDAPRAYFSMNTDSIPAPRDNIRPK